jgi:hypothetical protein
MPEIYRKDKLLRNKKHLSLGKSIEFTEEEKSKVTRCKGIRSTHPCKDPVFRCKICGNSGCSQVLVDKCSAQGFKNAKCLHCGAIDNKIPVMSE